MSFHDRAELISRIETLRGSHVICYLTTIRPNVSGEIAEDAVRVFFDHLLRLPSRPVDKLDVFLCSNGGKGTVPWRLVSLLREFTKHLGVLVPFRAYSAATLLALGADEIVMHPFGELGPIDPTVSNDFNPKSKSSGRRLGISVEDVKAYVNFIKGTVGITHEDELIRAIEILAKRVHPLALGNVERFIAQSRMVARKLLRTHMGESESHAIDEIVENMASKLFFHGHPINRMEAKHDLRLKVNLDLPPALESVMWELYLSFEAEFENLTVFDPEAALKAQVPADKPEPGTFRAISTDCTLTHGMVESRTLSSKVESTRKYILALDAEGKPSVRKDILSQGWTHTAAAQVASLAR